MCAAIVKSGRCRDFHAREAVGILHLADSRSRDGSGGMRMLFAALKDYSARDSFLSVTDRLSVGLNADWYLMSYVK